MQRLLVAAMLPGYFLGLILAAFAALLWIVAAVAGTPDVWTLLGLGTISIGFVVSAGGERTARPVLVPVGFVAVGVGVILFYRGDLWSGIYNVAGLLFVGGALAAAGGAWRNAVLPQKLGLAVTALASLIWVYADFGFWWWQPGNVMMAIACTTAAWGAGGRQRPKQEKTEKRAVPRASE